MKEEISFLYEEDKEVIALLLLFFPISSPPVVDTALSSYACFAHQFILHYTLHTQPSEIDETVGVPPGCSGCSTRLAYRVVVCMYREAVGRVLCKCVD